MKIITKIMLLLPCIVITAIYAHKLFLKPINNEELIERIMQYPMSYVTEQCKDDFGYSDEDIQILERELKRYLAMSLIINGEKLGIGMYSKDVDNLWHSFILSTKNYAQFCDTCIGRFIHHVPENIGRFINHEPEADSTESPEKRAETRRTLDFKDFIKNYEQLFHEEVHPVWFVDMCVLPDDDSGN